MRSVLLACVCGIIACATALQVRDNEFTPAPLPCGCRIVFEEVSYSYGTKNVISSYIAQYGRYLARSSENKNEGISNFKVIRLDVEDPDNPGNVGLFDGFSFGSSGSCSSTFARYGDLVDNIPGYKYFNGSFTYTTNNDNDEWEGQSCKSYTSTSNSGTETIYLDGQDRVIAVVVVSSSSSNSTLRAITYEDKAEGRFFRMPDEFSSSDCNSHREIYKSLTAKEENCELYPDSDVFVPAKLPCAFKVTYEEDIADEDGARTFHGWFAMYGRYLAQFQEGPVDGRQLELHSVVRLDIPDPKDPNTAGVFFGMSVNGMAMCEFEGYNSYDSLYHDMGDESEFLTENYKFTSKKDDDEWEGKKCKSYTRSYGSSSSTTIYADDKNNVLAVKEIGESENRTIKFLTMEEKAEGQYFKIPRKYPGCSEDYPEVYENPTKKEDGCELAPDTDASISSRVEVTFVTVILAVMVSLFLF